MPQAAIRYVFGNRLEALAERLADDLARAPLRDPLQHEVVIVPHPGMGRWLQQFFAQRWGIAAFMRFLLPAEFGWQALRAMHPRLPEQSAFEPEALQWRIHGMLPSLLRKRELEPVARYLDDGDPLKRFELSQRLAAAFDQYFVYRPRWLAQWSSGKLVGLSGPHEAWQATLWRTLREAIGEPHRVELLRDATRRAGEVALDLSPLASRVAMFGVSALPPVYLELFAALSAHVPSHWYHVNPSAEYWGDIVLRKERPAMIAKLARQGVAEPDRHLDEGHRLLASWGTIGRDFLKLLYELPVALDDEAVAVADDPSSLLAWLRTGLSKLRSDWAPPPSLANDESLRIYACASRQREVEVAHDVLLSLFERDPTLTPRDVALMTPRLSDYAPLVEAVFGSAPAERQIPYTVADRPLAETHPLLDAFRLLLDLPHSRLGASDVLALLDVPAIARRAQLTRDDTARIVRWIDALRVRWGLDAADRAAQGAAAFEEFAWRPALDRLMLGQATGEVDDLVGDVLPYPDVEGQGAAAAGALSRLVERLADWRTRLDRARTVRAWQKVLSLMLFELIDSDGADAGEIAATRAITGMLKAWAESVRRAGEGDTPIEYAVARAALIGRLDSPETHQRLLSTGVTVCAMVPMRNVPFRVVWLLGLDDGDFPRREPATSLNLMRGAREVGDRTRADDDRYLFLEALLAAGDSAHLSYVAINAKDGSARAPAQPVQELLESVVGAYAAAERDGVRRAIAITPAHAAYEPAAFAPGAMPPSFAAEWLPAARAAAGAMGVPEAFVDLVQGGRADDVQPVSIALDDLFAFYRHPPRDFARRVLELELPDPEIAEDDEPFQLSGLERFALDDAVLARVLARPAEDDGEIVAWLRAQNLLRPGALGTIDAREHALEVRPLAEAYRAHLAESEMSSVEVDRIVGAFRVHGRIDGVTPRGPLRLKAGAARASDWIALGVSALLLDQPNAWFLCLKQGACVDRKLDVARLGEQWLEAVLRTYAAGREGVVPMLRYSSWQWAEAYAEDSDADKARKAALDRLRGRSYGDEPRFREIDDPYVALALRGRDERIDETFTAVARALLVPIVQAIAP